MFWQACQVLSKLTIGTKKSGRSFNWQTQHGVSWGSKTRTIIDIGAVQGTQSWCLNQSNFVCFEKILVTWKEHIPHGLFLLTNNQSERIVYGQEKHQTNLFLVNSESTRFGHRHSGRLIGQDQFMSQEWYCTSKAVAQIMMVLIFSIDSRRRFSISSKQQWRD